MNVKLLLFIIVLFSDTKDIKKDMKVEIKTESTERPVIQETDLTLLASLIECEGSGENYYGMLCIGNVVLNRTTDIKTMSKVIFERSQFAGIRTRGFKDRKASDKAINAAFDLLSGQRVLSKKYRFFMNPKTATDKQMFEILKACPFPIYAGSQVFFY